MGPLKEVLYISALMHFSIYTFSKAVKHPPRTNSISYTNTVKININLKIYLKIILYSCCPPAMTSQNFCRSVNLIHLGAIQKRKGKYVITYEYYNVNRKQTLWVRGPFFICTTDTEKRIHSLFSVYSSIPQYWYELIRMQPLAACPSAVMCRSVGWEKGLFLPAMSSVCAGAY